MHEVNSIAKIVTESVDPDAKIIFGPIHDDKLKKGEVKVTVIATGFQGNPKKISGGTPVMVQRSAPAQQAQQQIPIERKEIHNSLPDNAPAKRPVEKVIEEISDDDGDEWASAVPAFLRRSKK